jgi:hypothetical protein
MFFLVSFPAQVKDDVRAGVLSLVEKEREGDMVDRDLLKQVVNVFVEIGDWRPLFPTRVGEEIGDIGQARLNTVMTLPPAFFSAPFIAHTLLC